MPAVPKDKAKELAAMEGAKLVKPGEITAIGSGSTVDLLLKALSLRFPTKEERPRLVTASSNSDKVATRLGFEVIPLEEVESFRIMLDGADEVDQALTLIKGGGGAHTREKLLARMSKCLVIMVDYSKLVRNIGRRFPIPVEVVPFAVPQVMKEIRKLSIDPRLRTKPGDDDVPFVTDNGNQVLDCTLGQAVDDAAALDQSISRIVGVVETGLFIGMTSHLLVGTPNGDVEDITPGPGASEAVLKVIVESG